MIENKRRTFLLAPNPTIIENAGKSKHFAIKASLYL